MPNGLPLTHDIDSSRLEEGRPGAPQKNPKSGPKLFLVPSLWALSVVLKLTSGVNVASFSTGDTLVFCPVLLCASFFNPTDFSEKIGSWCHQKQAIRFYMAQFGIVHILLTPY